MGTYADYLMTVFGGSDRLVEAPVEAPVKPAQSMVERLRVALAAQQDLVRSRHIPPKMTVEEIFARAKPIRSR